MVEKHSSLADDSANYIILEFVKHHIAITIQDNSICRVDFIQPGEAVNNEYLRKAMASCGLLNDSGVIASPDEVIIIRSALDPVDAALEEATVRQFQSYFAGDLREFSLPYHPERGTAFQRSVWQVMKSIPYGATLSYLEVAERLTDDKQKARNMARAVGSACGKNPIGILIPCHRVIGKDKSLIGFGGGLELKKALLDLEGAKYK